MHYFQVKSITIYLVKRNLIVFRHQILGLTSEKDRELTQIERHA